jgi:hypothetical protein
MPGEKSDKFGVYCKHDPAHKGDYWSDVSLTATEDPDIPGGELRHKACKYARVPWPETAPGRGSPGPAHPMCKSDDRLMPLDKSQLVPVAWRSQSLSKM